MKHSPITLFVLFAIAFPLALIAFLRKPQAMEVHNSEPYTNITVGQFHAMIEEYKRTNHYAPTITYLPDGTALKTEWLKLGVYTRQPDKTIKWDWQFGQREDGVLMWRKWE